MAERPPGGLGFLLGGLQAGVQSHSVRWAEGLGCLLGCLQAGVQSQ